MKTHISSTEIQKPSLIHWAFLIDSLIIIGIAFSYPIFFLFAEGIWKTVRHTYSSPYLMLSIHAALGFGLFGLFIIQFSLMAVQKESWTWSRKVHQLIGRIYLFGLSPSFVASAIYIAINNEIGFDSVSVYLVILAAVWFMGYAISAYWAIKQRAIEQHLDLMIMSLVLITIAALIRVVLYVDAILNLDLVGYQYRAITILLIVGKLFLFAWLRQIYGSVRWHLWLTTVSFVVVLLLFLD